MSEGEHFEVQVSDRLRRLPPYLFGKLNHMRDDKRREGVDIIDLGMGNPTDPPPPEIIEKLREAVLDPRNHRYSVSVGIYNLRRELTRLYDSYWGVKLDPSSEVVATIGSKEGFSHLCLALLGPGDTALVPSPAFPIHMYAVILAGASVINVPLAPGPELIRSFEQVTKHLQPRPKVVIVNFPHNPTAMVTELDFYKDLVRFAKKYNIMVMSDMAYGLTVFDGYKAPSFLEAPGAKDVGVEFTTMSKPFNMAGWRVGFCAGNADICKRPCRESRATTTTASSRPPRSPPSSRCAPTRETAPRQAAIYQARRDVLVDGLNRVGWEVEKPKGSMFVWAKMPKTFEHMGSRRLRHVAHGKRGGVGVSGQEASATTARDTCGWRSSKTSSASNRQSARSTAPRASTSRAPPFRANRPPSRPSRHSAAPGCGNPMTIQFKRGVHPPDAKRQTEGLTTRDLPAPETLVVPLSQHIGAPATPKVQKGDRVDKGQLIGEPAGFVSAAVHAPVSGEVVSVEPRLLALARPAACVIIRNDGEERWAPGANVEQGYSNIEPSAIVERVRAAGVVGMGGATFPTSVKLSPPEGKTIETLIVNGAECEPYLTGRPSPDARGARENPEGRRPCGARGRRRNASSSQSKTTSPTPPSP